MSAGEVPPEVLAAVDRGWSVIPCGPDKRPAVRSWKGAQEKPADRAQVERWATQRPASWAVVTGAVSGIVAFDFDGPDGRALRERHGLPEHCRTGSGGAHVYAEHPGTPVATLNGKAKHELGRRFPGLDVKGDGGYAIFAGRNGAGPYVLNDPNPLPLDALPAELAALLRDEQPANSAPPSADALLRWALDRVGVGSRNQTGFELACQLRDNRHDQGEAERTLRAYATRVPVGDEPYTEAEALASVRQAYAAPAREPWSDKRTSSSHTARGRAGYKVEWEDGPRGARKLKLPPPPAHDDVAGLCEWLTVVFNLDPAHPITGGTRDGLAGPDGHAVLQRAGAQALRFEPIKRIGTPAKLTEDLDGWGIPTDGEVYSFKTEHARKIHHAVRMLCGATNVITAEQETAAIVGTFLQRAEPVEEHTTYGTAAQSYEAASALRMKLGVDQYLIDKNTGELVIAVSDLQDTARRHVGSSLPRGWLDARMSGIGWERIRLDGHAVSGRAGRTGPHARVDAYRGHIPADDDDGSVTT